MALSLAVANTPFVTGFQTDWLYWHQSWFSSVFHNKFNPSYFNLQGGSKLGTQYIVYKLLLYTYFWPTLYIQQDATLHSLFYLEAVLHFSGRTITHHQERKQLYLQRLLFVIPLLLPAAIVEELELVWVCCGWRTPPTAHSNQFQML